MQIMTGNHAQVSDRVTVCNVTSRCVYRAVQTNSVNWCACACDIRLATRFDLKTARARRR